MLRGQDVQTDPAADIHNQRHANLHLSAGPLQHDLFTLGRQAACRRDHLYTQELQLNPTGQDSLQSLPHVVCLLLNDDFI